jgi:hypothetical protein
MYEESSGSKGKVPFNDILISNVEPKVLTNINGTEQSKPLAAILLSSVLLGTVLLGGFFYSSEVYNYSIRALTDVGILKKEALAVQSGEDLNSMPVQQVVEPVPSVVQPAIQPATQPITQPVNKNDVAR